MHENIHPTELNWGLSSKETANQQSLKSPGKTGVLLLTQGLQIASPEPLQKMNRYIYFHLRG